MSRTAFELIRKNSNRDRHIYNVSDCGVIDMRTLFQESCRNMI